MHGEISGGGGPLLFTCTILSSAHAESSHYAGSCLHVTSIPWLCYTRAYNSQTNNGTERSIHVSTSISRVVIDNLAYDIIYSFQVAAFVLFDGSEIIGQKSSITHRQYCTPLG